MIGAKLNLSTPNFQYASNMDNKSAPLSSKIVRSNVYFISMLHIFNQLINRIVSILTPYQIIVFARALKTNFKV